MKIIITENQQKNLNSYIRRIDRMFHEYLEENWPEDELCDGPFSPEIWDKNEYGDVYDYFVNTNMKSLTGEILERLLTDKFGDEDYTSEEFIYEYRFVLDLLKKLGYEEKMGQYLYDVLENCEE
jgi:hypothetical protein